MSLKFVWESNFWFSCFVWRWGDGIAWFVFFLWLLVCLWSLTTKREGNEGILVQISCFRWSSWWLEWHTKEGNFALGINKVVNGMFKVRKLSTSCLLYDVTWHRLLAMFYIWKCSMSTLQSITWGMNNKELRPIHWILFYILQSHKFLWEIYMPRNCKLLLWLNKQFFIQFYTC